MGLHPRCPAASPVHPAADGPSILCGVLRLANEGEDIGGFTHRAEADPVMSGAEMALTVSEFCCGTGVPGSMCSYTNCAIWRAQREAEWAGSDELRDDVAIRPPTVRDQVVVG